MRLWHKDLIEYLPKLQLVAQWRELNSIYVHQNNHILINYIYTYPKEYLLSYSNCIINEMKKRGIKINSYLNYTKYFKGIEQIDNLKFKEHDDDYLKICYYNLYEKYLRGQKDFSENIFSRLNIYINNRIVLK